MKETIEEFHPNGQLAYTETRLYLDPKIAHLYENRIVVNEKESFVRVGDLKKFFDNGQLAWHIRYDERGRFIKDKAPTFRKDGTQIDLSL